MNLLIIAVLLVIIAETTYLAIRAGRPQSVRSNGRPVFVDTSVLIDGRIIAVAQSGFITSKLLIPRSVVGELQLLADQGDHEKRTRARHGLDIVSELQALPMVTVEIFNDGTSAREGVDNRLLELAKRYNGAICTIDFNLNKVAQVEQIPVLNVNDLAMNLRMAYLPGERVMIELTQKGNDAHQGIGHLQDGTMVVVEQASSLIGQRVEIEFIRSLQTAAGKMMFARLVHKPTHTATPQKKPTVKQASAAKKASPAGRKPAAQTTKKRPTQSRKKFDKEDSLIALVNQQDQ